MIRGKKKKKKSPVLHLRYRLILPFPPPTTPPLSSSLSTLLKKLFQIGPPRRGGGVGRQVTLSSWSVRKKKE